jgi:hypothetical protein
MAEEEEERSRLPPRLASLHRGEEMLRGKACEIVERDERLQLHLVVVERSMDLADRLRQFETEDEDLRLLQLLGMRTFNALGASLKLALSGYSQNSALIMRDILETVFLLDLFRGDRLLIERWRLSDKPERMKAFSPLRVREALDVRDGFTSRKRAEMYEMFCELAGHPTMKSVWMMRPEKEGDAVIGPFIETTTVEAVLSEMGRLAIQVGDVVAEFMPVGWPPGVPVRLAFIEAKAAWIGRFYPHGLSPSAASPGTGAETEGQ